MTPEVRFPTFAEEFYPTDPLELETLLKELIPEPETVNGNGLPKAILVPHGAYSYSGMVAAEAYRRVQGKSWGTVFIMGDAHAYRFNGIAIDPHLRWSSPLGEVAVNTAVADQLINRAPDLFRKLDIAHHCDHVLEVQLPLLQHALKPGFSILPFLFGDNPHEACRQTADLLESVMEDQDLLVVSTDLSHFPAYRDAKLIDRKTLDLMVKLDLIELERYRQEIRQRQIPGAIEAYCSPCAVRGLLELARRKGWKAVELGYRNSGDALYDDKQAVVGYGAIAFHS